MTQRDFVREGRSEKALRIVAVIDSICTDLGRDGTIDAEEVLRILRGLSDESWHRLQRATGNARKEPPSEATRTLVLQVYEQRVLAAARFDEPESDTFAMYFPDEALDEEGIEDE